MTKNQIIIKNQMIETTKKQSLENLKIITESLYFADDDAAIMALGVCLEELQTRLSENDFINFCNSID